LEQDGAGHYWGAFQGDQLVAFAGFYHQAGLGRFQHVRTLPNFQRKGLCKSLLCTIIKQAISQGIETLVIVADEHYHATALYGSLGFEITSREASLCWWPKR
jgi:ribosomal protein S18 acetylase RimI-like enzyme